MKTLLTLLIAGALVACQVEPATAPAKDVLGAEKGYHPCLDAFTAALDTTEGCAELKLIHPNCFGCDFGAEGSAREVQSAWELRCAAMQCEWCAADPFVCD